MRHRGHHPAGPPGWTDGRLWPHCTLHAASPAGSQWDGGRGQASDRGHVLSTIGASCATVYAHASGAGGRVICQVTQTKLKSPGHPVVLQRTPRYLGPTSDLREAGERAVLSLDRSARQRQEKGIVFGTCVLTEPFFLLGLLSMGNSVQSGRRNCQSTAECAAFSSCFNLASSALAALASFSLILPLGLDVGWLF